MVSMVLRDSTLESLTPSVNTPLFKYFIRFFPGGTGGHLLVPLLIIPVPLVIVNQLWQNNIGSDMNQ